MQQISIQYKIEFSRKLGKNYYEQINIILDRLIFGLASDILSRSILILCIFFVTLACSIQLVAEY